MKLFSCPGCHAPVYFENQSCLQCGQTLAYAASSLSMVAIGQNNSQASSASTTGDPARWVPCDNRDTAAACNWAVSLNDVARNDDSRLCNACVLTSVYPDQTTEENADAWRVAEQAKRRWLYTIHYLRLPANPKSDTNPTGLTFRLLQPDAGTVSVLTGHQDGVITINAAECDPVARLEARQEMDEPYRTLRGHVRHESGHYYWQRLIEPDGNRLSACRDVFGDERADYSEALAGHYRAGPPDDWSDRFVSAYAASHPWEDFAETWAHYLHIVDALDVAESWGLTVSGYPQTQIDKFADQVPRQSSFHGLVERWLPLSLFINSLSRSLGHEDAYPFAPAPTVLNKMLWIHELVSTIRAPQTS